MVSWLLASYARFIEARGSTSCEVLVDLAERLHHRTELSPT